MGKFIEQLGQGIATQGAGAAFGLLLGGINDQRQLDQQQALQDMQIKGQMALTDYNTKKQYEMWQKTNYGPQVEQMKKAGLNPALMYGQAGAGGSTGISAGNVAGAEAPKGGGEAQAGMGMMMQSQLLQAQIRNIDADTKVKLEGLPNVGKTGANIDADTANKNLDASLKRIELMISDKTKEDKTDKIKAEANIAMQNSRIATQNATIKDHTAIAEINTINAKAVTAILENQMILSNIRLNDAEINKMAADIAQGWTKLQIEQQNADSNTRNAAEKAYENDIMAAIAKYDRGPEAFGKDIARRIIGGLPVLTIGNLKK